MEMLLKSVIADCVNVEIGLAKSDVFSAFANPTIILEMPVTVPVKDGFIFGAFVDKAVVIVDA